MAEVIDLTGDDDEEVVAVVPTKKRKKEEKKDKAPAWASRTGRARLMLEFKALREEWTDSPLVYDVEMVNDMMNVWQFKVKGFDESSKGGQDLNRDLAKLSEERGQDHILMEASFPSDYPNSPLFLRLITPRMMWYTGHVTAGGAICIEALTSGTSPGAWRPSHCVEAVLRTVFANMVFCEVGFVRTATGPGGKTGPLRVDLGCRYIRDVLHPYSISEAKSAFSRMLSHHQRHGW